MCIVLLTTAHPQYALIVINNRDEFILRPTSRPHWWTTRATSDSSSNGDDETETQHILSSRDLLRPEQGTWLGVTRAGHFAVLTNYRELQNGSGAPSVAGRKSRGGMVTAWLGAPRSQGVADFVEGMIAEGGTQGVGGFSLICGKLRKGNKGGEADAETEAAAMEPLGILSNKAVHPNEIPWIAGRRDETVGLSNAAYDNPVEWPKVTKGKALLEKVVAEAVEEGVGEEELQQRLFWVLDRDELPSSPDMGFEDYFKVLQESVFIPLIGDQKNRDDMIRMAQKTGSEAGSDAHADSQLEPPEAATKAQDAQQAEGQPQAFATGMYGTQRQTVMLVDWHGNVTYTERALWDADGRAVEKGKGDVTFRFPIEGWEQSH